MKVINHEYYVSLEVAKLLKEAGFDWECRGYFDGIEFHPNGSVECTNYNSNTCKYLKAPTLDVAQRWLREVKGIYIGIVAIENKRAVTNSDGWTFHYEYGKPIFDCDIQNERCETISTLDDSFDIYEEAQESGIKKALEMILKKGE